MKHVLCSGQGFMLHQDGADKWKNMAEVGFREALFKKFIHQIVTSAFGFFSQRKASSFQYPANLKSQGSYPLGQLLLKKKRERRKSAGKDMDKLQHFYAAGGDVNWCSHCGE